MSWEKHEAPVVTYVGTNSTSYGLAVAGEFDIKTEHTLVGFPRSTVPGISSAPFRVGNRAWAHRSMDKLSIPLHNGCIKADKLDDFKKVLEYAYTEASGTVDDPHPLLSVERAFDSSKDREATAEVAFETLNVPSFVSASTPLMALHSVSLRDALVLHMGSTASTIYPVRDGKVDASAVRSLGIGGTTLTQEFMRALSDAGFALTGSQSVFEQIDEAKKSLCFVSEDPKADLDAASATPGLIHKEWQIAEGASITVGTPRFLALECLFDPSLARLNEKSLPQLISEAIKASKYDELPPLVLSGGSSLIPGLSKRICKEISGFIGGQQLEVLEPHPREALPAIGGLSFASDRDRFKKFAVSKEEYLEKGAKCFEKKEHIVRL